MRVKDDKKHKAICDAAVELITANGLAHTSISKIAGAAGVSPATIYVYFKNKEDLLNKLYVMVKKEKSAALLRGFDENMEIEEAFRIIWNNFYEYAFRNPVKFAFGEQFFNSPVVNLISREEGMGYYQPMVELFERGKKEGIFRDIPLEIFAAFTFSPLMSLIKGEFGEDLKLDDETLDLVFKIVWDAVTN